MSETQVWGCVKKEVSINEKRKNKMTNQGYAHDAWDKIHSLSLIEVGMSEIGGIKILSVEIWDKD